MRKKKFSQHFSIKLIANLISLLVVATAIINFIASVYPLINDLDKLSTNLSNFKFDIFIVLEEILAYVLLVSGFALVGRSRVMWIFCVATLCTLIFISTINYKLLVYNHLHYFLFIKLFTLAILLSTRKYFNRQLYLTYSFVFIAAFIIFALLYGSIGCYVLRAQFMNLHDFSDALYFSITTYSTVGFGDIYPKTTAAKYFVMSMVLIGLIMFTSGITILAFMLNDKIKNMLLHLNKGKINMTNHIVFYGYGVFTKILMERYRKSGHQFILIDRPQDISVEHQRLQTENRLITIPYPGDTQTMIKACLNEAKMVIIGYENDVDVVFAVMNTKKFLTQHVSPSHHPQIVARITYEENIALAKNAGADHIIAPQLLVAEAINAIGISL